MAIIVSDTSPLRALAYLALMDLLPALFARVLIPPAVVAALGKPRSSRLSALSVQEWPFLQVQAPTRVKLVKELAVRLGAGEAEAIALASEVRADTILIDEAQGACRRAGPRSQAARCLGCTDAGKAQSADRAVDAAVGQARNRVGFLYFPGASSRGPRVGR